MLTLPRVTLCCVDCINHDLALAALDQCARQCAFARILFVTDREYAIDGVDCVRIAPIASREAYSRFVIKELGSHIATDFVLLVQWDGFVVNAHAWSDDFLDYDYIGAKWTFHGDAHTVGNGGFSLRSRRLLEALRDPHIVPGPLEDVAICRTSRSYLEQRHGIRFAPEDVADRFSFEASYFDSLPFGFHGLFNFWMFLGKAQLATFLGMATPRILASVQCLRLARNYAESVGARKRPCSCAGSWRHTPRPRRPSCWRCSTPEPGRQRPTPSPATRHAHAAAASATRRATAGMHSASR